MSLIVGASESDSRRWCMDVEWDFNMGVRVRYFLESVAMRILPEEDSLAGRW